MLGISKSISKKLGISIALLFLLNLITVIAFFYIFTQQKAYGPAINDSGRLRMMSQRASKDVFLISSGHNEVKEDLVIVSEDYDKTLGDLMTGSKDRGIVAPSNDVGSQLSKVKGLWEGIRTNIKVVVSVSDKKDPKFEEAVNYIRDNNMALLKEANNAVVMYEKESETKLNGILIAVSTLMSILGLAVLIVVIGIIRKITTSISDLTKATKTISRFSLVSNIKVDSEDEIGELAKNFNLMVENMKNSMEQQS